jgi:hypothetical protein
MQIETELALKLTSTSQHWLQKHVDLLSYTFGRRITGVLNPT